MKKFILNRESSVGKSINTLIFGDFSSPISRCFFVMTGPRGKAVCFSARNDWNQYADEEGNSVVYWQWITDKHQNRKINRNN